MSPVGVLTFTQTMNYGAELQALALKMTIDRLGYESEMVNYANMAVSDREKVRYPGLCDLAHPRRVIKMLCNYGANKQRFAGCRAFSSKYNVFGDEVQSVDEIYAHYAAVVVGSDQVWNPTLTDGDMTFFLPDSHGHAPRRIAYAASFGDAFDAIECEGEYRDSVKGFDAIGIREAYAAEKLESVLKRDVAAVLDPTLLIERASWEGMERAPSRKIGDEGFVFVYCIAEHVKALEFACRIAADRGLSVLAIDSMGLPRKGVTYVNSASPEHFLWYIHHAKCVVTSSFHGVCFSVLYGKDFWYSLPDRANRSSSRIVDLLYRLEIEGGEVLLEGECPSPISVDEAILESRRGESLAFLANALAGLEEE